MRRRSFFYPALADSAVILARTPRTERPSGRREISIPRPIDRFRPLGDAWFEGDESMSNRRAFLQAAGGAALAFGAFGAYGQAAPKRVMVGGRRVPVIDVHAHCVFPEVSRRVPGINAPRVAPPTLCSARADRRDGRARHRHAGAQRQYVLVVLGEPRRCARRRRDARRRHRGVVQAAPDALRRLELRRAAVSRTSRRSSSSTPSRISARAARRSAATSTTSRRRAKSTTRSGPRPRSSACPSSCIRTTR